MLVKKENWMKVARAVGDLNPIHYDDEYAKRVGLDTAVCAGVYLLALAERESRDKWSELARPFCWKGTFANFVYDKDEIKFENDGLLTLVSQGKDAAKFQQRNSRDDAELKIPLESRMDITEENVRLFYEGMESDGKEPYFTFAIGAIISKFLEGREGVMLRRMVFNLYEPPKIGEVNVGLEVSEKIAGGNTFYSINSVCQQEGKNIITGTGTGFRFKRE